VIADGIPAVIRVLLADDQTLVRDGFRSIVDREADMTVVGEAGNGKEAVDKTRELRPDVVLMDIRMPVLDGLEATRLVLTGPTSARVLVLTTFDRDEYVYEALRAGASGFLLKDIRRGQLTEAIRTVAAGERLLSPAITTRLIEDYLRAPPGGATAARLAQLSSREREVVTLVARGLANAEIAQALFLSTTTVKTHVARILAKLDLRDRVQIVVLAYEAGLVRPTGGAPG
jgi:DNA-binding NarL/FixJ family response regulator